MIKRLLHYFYLIFNLKILEQRIKQLESDRKKHALHLSINSTEIMFLMRYSNRKIRRKWNRLIRAEIESINDTELQAILNSHKTK